MILPRPEPSAGMREYDAERGARFLTDLRTATNHVKYLSARNGASDIDYLPIKLDIENVSRCNFACTMCAVSKWEHGKRAGDMSFEDFKKLIDEQYGLIEIKLNGLGEALMQGDVYFEMIKYARKKHIWVRMTTNASLLHLRDNYKKLIDSGVNEIDISIDGHDQQTFEGIRIQSDFNKVIDNCRLLNSYCESKKITRTKMWTLVQKGNVANLDKHLHLAKWMGFKHVVFSTNLHGWADPELEKRNKEEQVNLSEDDFKHLIELGENLEIRVSFWDVNDKFETKPGKRCPWPFSRAVVTSDLRTVPCCMIGDPDKYEIGKGKTFMQNWKSVEYQDFRKAHLEGKIPDVCKACYK